MRHVVYIGGIKGVGKSTVFFKLLAHPSIIDLHYKRAKIAEKMFEMLQARRLIKRYEELETINIELKKEIRLRVFQEVLKKEGNLIFDGHYAISSSYGYSYGIPLEMVGKIDYFVLLHHNPKVILERRKKDTSKERDLSLKKIELDLILEEALAKFYASITGKTLIRIKTDNKAPYRLMNFLKEVNKNG